MIYEGPVSGSVVTKEEAEQTRVADIVAVNLHNGETLSYPSSMERGTFVSIVPLGKHRCGIAAWTNCDSWKRRLQEWDLQNGKLGSVREWRPIDVVAKAVDFEKVSLGYLFTASRRN